MRRRHAQHFAARLGQATAEWETTPTPQWMTRYESDIDNLRGALEWAFAPDGDAAIGIELVGRSHVLWAELAAMPEHRHWVGLALGKTDKRTPADAAARLLSWQAGDVRELDDPADYDEAVRAASLYRKLGDRFQEGRVLLRAGTARLLPDNASEGKRLLEQAYALVKPLGATKTMARCLSALASAHLFAGDLDEARVLHEQAVGVYRELGEVAAPALPVE